MFQLIYWKGFDYGTAHVNADIQGVLVDDISVRMTICQFGTV